MIYIKKGVNLEELSPQIVLALRICECVYEAQGCLLRITSVYRKDQGLHGKGRAVDLGIRDLNGEVYPDVVIDKLVKTLKEHLDEQFDIVDERNAPGGAHIHLEYDPR